MLKIMLQYFFGFWKFLNFFLGDEKRSTLLYFIKSLRMFAFLLLDFYQVSVSIIIHSIDYVICNKKEESIILYKTNS